MSYGGDGTDDVRAPDPTTKAKLIPENLALMSSQPARKSGIASAFASGGKSFKPKTEHDITLAKLYGRPTDIMFVGGFYEARQHGKADDKWLIVNIQCEEEFDCHKLNRDVWSNESLKELIQCNFVFWQQLNNTSEAETFIRTYKVGRYPYIAILDPRTAGIVWSAEGSSVFKNLSEKLEDFTSRGPPSENSTLKRRNSSSSDSVSNSSDSDISLLVSAETSKRPRQKQYYGGESEPIVVNDDELGLSQIEDEELKEAIALSMKCHSESTLVSGYYGVSEKSAVLIDISDEGETVAEKVGKERASTNAKSLSSNLESISGFSVKEILYEDLCSKDEDRSAVERQQTKLSIKLPSGKKLADSFDTQQSVLQLLKYVAKQLSEDKNPAASDRFELFYQFPTKTLSDVLNTVEECARREKNGTELSKSTPGSYISLVAKASVATLTDVDILNASVTVRYL